MGALVSLTSGKTMADISLDFLKTAARHIVLALSCHYTMLPKRIIRISLAFDRADGEIRVTTLTRPSQHYSMMAMDFTPLMNQSRDFSEDLKYLLFSNIITFEDLQKTDFLSGKNTLFIYEEIPALQTAHDIMQTHAFLSKHIHVKTPSLMDFQSLTFEGQQS